MIDHLIFVIVSRIDWRLTKMVSLYQILEKLTFFINYHFFHDKKVEKH